MEAPATSSSSINSPIDTLKSIADKLAPSSEVYPTIDKLIKDAEKKIKKLKGKFSEENISKYWYYSGKIYSFSNNYNSQCIDCYTKSIKLQPENINAWNDLGEVFCRIKNLPMAQSCFLGALRQGKNKISIRNLSIVLRELSPDKPDQHRQNVKEGLKLAREAIEIDPNDGISWMVLGNAYLSAMFAGGERHEYSMKGALEAYEMAEKFEDCKKNPVLFFNKAAALKYEEMYEQAIKSLQKALELEPEWKSADNSLQFLLRYVTLVSSLNENKGKLCKRKIKKLVEAFKKPCIGGFYKRPEYAETHTDELQEGLNPKKIIVGVVLWSNQLDDSFPFTFGILDKKGKTVVVTIFNMAAGKGVLIGDTVAIPNPFLTAVNFTANGTAITFLKIRLDCPLHMLVNNKQIAKEFRGSSTITTEDIH